MSHFADLLLPKIKLRLRETKPNFDDEIKTYIDGAAQNLMTSGVLPSFFDDEATEVDPEIEVIIGTYALANFGLYDKDMREFYFEIYERHKITMLNQVRFNGGI